MAKDISYILTLKTLIQELEKEQQSVPGPQIQNKVALILENAGNPIQDRSPISTSTALTLLRGLLMEAQQSDKQNLLLG